MPIPPVDGPLTELAELAERTEQNHVPPAWSSGCYEVGGVASRLLKNETRRHIPPNQGAAFSCCSFCDEAGPARQVKSHQASFFSLESCQTSSIEDG